MSKMIWEFKVLIIFFILDIFFNIFGYTTGFSIGGLIYMIINYKDIKRRIKNE